VILVALLTGSLEDARVQARVAATLGVTPYEARLALAGGFPAVLMTTADRAKADAVVATLRTAGDDVIACDASDVVAASAMVPFDRFTFEAAGVVAGGQTLPYDDVLCLLRAVHRGRTATETRTTERRFSAGKSLLSGGLANTKTVTKTTSESAESRDPVVYVFRRSGATPWILREAGTHYEGLGASRGLTTVENFATTIRLLRERAPGASYDERLVRAQRTLERSSLQGTSSHATVTTSSASGVDVLAHLLARSLVPSKGPR
jgi:hypothetical protein